MALSRDFIDDHWKEAKLRRNEYEFPDGEPTWTDEDRIAVRIIGRVALMAFGIGVLLGAICGGLLLVYAISR